MCWRYHQTRNSVVQIRCCNKHIITFRENLMGISFQFTKQTSVLQIKQSGMRGRLPSTVLEKMDTCVSQTNISHSC